MPMETLNINLRKCNIYFTSPRNLFCKSTAFDTNVFAHAPDPSLCSIPTQHHLAPSDWHHLLQCCSNSPVIFQQKVLFFLLSTFRRMIGLWNSRRRLKGSSNCQRSSIETSAFTRWIFIATRRESTIASSSVAASRSRTRLDPSFPLSFLSTPCTVMPKPRSC